MKRWLANLFIVILLLSLTGCISYKENNRETERDTIVISVLAGQSTSDKEWESYLIFSNRYCGESIQKNFPQVYLEWECVDWGDQFNTQMKSRIAAGEIPDIIIGKAQDVQIYAKAGNLAKISDSYLGKIQKDALKEVTVDGVVYGIPYNAWYQGVIYNKDIFKKYKLTPPTTGEELEDVVACLEKKGIVPFASHFQES